MKPVELTPATTYFRIFYDPSLKNGLANATAFKESADYEFVTLADWFTITEGFGPSNLITVNLIYKDGSGSDNRGYSSDGSTVINLNGSPNATPSADVIRMHFIAELSEVMMSYNNQHGPATWDRLASHGEGLSQYCAYLKAPAGYRAFYGARFVNDWMSRGRPDWVANTDPTDKNAISFGCALLYLFYLQSQLGFEPQTIVRNGGASLAETYTKLTGDTNAFGRFVGLLDRFFPRGAEDAHLRVVNPFPLLDFGRNVTLAAERQDIGEPQVLRSGIGLVRFLLTCPEGSYAYDVVGQPYALEVTAKTHGFGAASFSWSINGMALTGSDETISVPAQVTEQAPDLPGGSITSETNISVQFSVLEDDTLTSRVRFTIFEPFGKYDLIVTASAVEVFNTAPPSATGTYLGFMDNLRVEWDSQYYTGKAACEAPFLDVLKAYVRGNSWLDLALVQPDPPPELGLAVRTLRNLANEVAALGEAPDEVHRALEELLQARLNVSGISLRRLLDPPRISEQEPPLGGG